MVDINEMSLIVVPRRDFGSGQVDVINFDSASTAGHPTYAALTSGVPNYSTSSTPMPSSDDIWSALVPSPSPTSTETGLATLELSSELAMSMMSTFNISHG